MAVLIASANVGHTKARTAATPGPPNRDTVLFTIGVLDGDSTQQFGRIRDVEVDGAGNTLVLDDQNHSVSWFRPDGTFRDLVGRDGDGPQEFRALVGMSIGPDGSVYVLDAARRRVAVPGSDGSDGACSVA